MKFSNCQVTDARVALVFMSLFAIFSGAIVTYISSMITTLEKRFELSSMEIGALMGANDIGYLTSVIFVAYYGSKKNRQPILLFCSGIGLWLSCMTYTVPYLIYGSKFDPDSLLNINISIKSGLCVNRTKITSNVITADEIISKEKSITMLVLMIAGIINGVASTPFWSLGISLLDDMAGPTKSGIYIGTLYATRTFSPIFGFMLGSHVLKYHESLKFKVHQYLPGQKDIKWVGAWWLGWFILGFCMLLPSMFMIFLKVRKSNVNQTVNNTHNIEFQKNHTINEEEDTEVKIALNANKKSSEAKAVNEPNENLSLFDDIRNLLDIIKESVKNRIFMSLITGMICEIVSFIWMLTFFTKFLEYHFRVSPSMTNIMTGLCLSGSSVISSMISGITSRLYKTTLRNMNRYHAVVNTIAALIFPVLFFFTCSSSEIVGLNEQTRLITCSDKCGCEPTKLEPVCLNMTTFLSPCLAGCTQQINRTVFSKCGCQKSLFATIGFCEKMCFTVYGFLIAYFFIRIIGSIASVQFTQILMRLNNPKFKAVNLSLIGFIFGICGLSLPPLVGVVLDTACTYRNVNKFGGKSHCLTYDNEKMRYIILGVSFVLQIPASILYICSWLYTPSDYVYKEKTKKNAVTSVTK